MPASLVIDSINFTGSPDFDTQSPPLRWMRGMVIGPREYEKAFPDSPGVDGTARKRFGFRQRKLTFTVTYVDNSYNNTLADAIADMDGIANKSFTVTVAGQTFPACELDTSSSITQPLSTGLTQSNFYLFATYVIVQKGLA